MENIFHIRLYKIRSFQSIVVRWQQAKDGKGAWEDKIKKGELGKVVVVVQ